VDFHDNNEGSTHNEEVDPEEVDPEEVDPEEVDREEIGSQDRGGRACAISSITKQG
jgi:hypothetical protein